MRGDKAFRKLIRQMPEAARSEMGEVLSKAGDRLLADMKADVPAKSGALRAGLEKKLLKASLRLRVGLIGKKRNNDLFYGRIIEFGRKAQDKITTKTTHKRSYKLRVRALAPRRFIFKGRPETRAGIGNDLRAFWDRALVKAAAGESFDG